MSHFQFQTVANIISGLGSIGELKALLHAGGYKKLLLVTDGGIIQQQLHAPIIEILDTLQLHYVVYSKVQADPP